MRIVVGNEGRASFARHGLDPHAINGRIDGKSTRHTYQLLGNASLAAKAERMNEELYASILANT